MSAPVGNQFWRQRSKHGREKLFTSPECLWEAACEYFDWCDKNPLIEIDFKGKDAVKVNIPKMRPYTIHGICVFFGCNTAYFRQFRAQLKDKEDEVSKEYSTVVTRIEEIIYTQKFEGAAAGFLNPNIIARDLGLVDKKEVESPTKIRVKFKPKDDRG